MLQATNDFLRLSFESKLFMYITDIMLVFDCDQERLFINNFVFMETVYPTYEINRFNKHQLTRIHVFPWIIVSPSVLSLLFVKLSV